MIRFTIDNQSIEVEEDTTILQAAERLGINIPTLCHLKIHEKGGSCMVCAVRNKQNKRLVPSCVGKCKDNPDIDASSDEMRGIREQLLQLVLSEHRGECVAPCQLSCPHDLNIPLIMYYVARGERDKARAYASPCGDCKRRCERGCRRQRIDKSLAIYDIVESLNAETQEVARASKRYAHKLTGFSEQELDNLQQIKFYEDDWQNESSRCLACGCFAHTQCQLQALATGMGIKKNSFAPSKREAKRHFFGTMCYDLGKCVKCANCVEVGNRLKTGTGPTLLQRGIHVEIGAPLGVDEASLFEGIEQECVDVCPTGALFWHQTSP